MSTLEALISTVGGPRWPFGDPREQFEVLGSNYGILGKTFGSLENMLGACILGPLSPTEVSLFLNFGMTLLNLVSHNSLQCLGH